SSAQPTRYSVWISHKGPSILRQEVVYRRTETGLHVDDHPTPIKERSNDFPSNNSTPPQTENDPARLYRPMRTRPLSPPSPARHRPSLLATDSKSARQRLD
ncbi:hypothetical protein CLAIMM_10718, partial [Cladophialophora immunda]